MSRSQWVGINEAGRVDLFWARVDRSAGPTACWPWSGARLNNGRGGPQYGHLRWMGKDTPAHRVALLLTAGPAPSSKPIGLHSCDNPPCCNPLHLFWGTYSENTLQAIERGRALPPQRRAGEDANNAKLTQQQVSEIRAAWPQETQVSLAQRFGVSQPAISYIVNRINWRD